MITTYKELPDSEDDRNKEYLQGLIGIVLVFILGMLVATFLNLPDYLWWPNDYKIRIHGVTRDIRKAPQWSFVKKSWEDDRYQLQLSRNRGGSRYDWLRHELDRIDMNKLTDKDGKWTDKFKRIDPNDKLESHYKVRKE